tara:strand:+ start:769 stop:1080 length:312 start_codon:yes stop_codon:yes gene_type:complete
MKGNKPLDRDYFKKKENPTWDKGPKLTKCCKKPVDHEVLNVNKKEDWEIIENHIQNQLRDYSSTESITPVSCKVCGRLLEYISVLNENTWTAGYLRKNKNESN